MGAIPALLKPTATPESTKTMSSKTSIRPSPTAISTARLVPSASLTELPTYVFAWLETLKAKARPGGAELIDLGMGNPDQPTPPPIIEAIAMAFADPSTHGYPPFRGTP